MTPALLLERLVALHAEHSEAHRRMVDALKVDDLLALVEASRRQGDICTEQGAVLADYIAAKMTAMPGIDAADRDRLNTLLRQLREDHDKGLTKVSGGYATPGSGFSP
jgi:hypothetical protein